ncbi:hypothetical protein Pyn_39218 [Prunus yedoensis var. nudiflora]|uniref:Uncharacterized protein n=1 Tax=Prunus yedoensis var. nudiflora TaxID=2094558 RepID=A0A314UUA0_PRUYE|nr:hypothetical protein Pyn_39218 [Prunus yedoensis var. nudiflora]
MSSNTPGPKSFGLVLKTSTKKSKARFYPTSSPLGLMTTAMPVTLVSSALLCRDYQDWNVIWPRQLGGPLGL